MKRYKEFITESNSWDYSKEELKEMLSTCEDILLDLKDEYFTTRISSSIPLLSITYPWIKFYISRSEEFTYSDISEVIETLKSYLKNFGLEIEPEFTWQRPDEWEPSIQRSGVTNPMTFEWEDSVISRCEIHFRLPSNK